MSLIDQALKIRIKGIKSSAKIPMERAEAPEVAIDALLKAVVVPAARPAAAWVDAAIPAAPVLWAAKYDN